MSQALLHSPLSASDTLLQAALGSPEARLGPCSPAHRPELGVGLSWSKGGTTRAPSSTCLLQPCSPHPLAPDFLTQGFSCGFDRRAPNPSGWGARDETEKSTEKRFDFIFSVSYRVGLIVSLESVICLSQNRVNDRLHAAASHTGWGRARTHTHNGTQRTTARVVGPQKHPGTQGGGTPKALRNKGELRKGNPHRS